MFTSIFIGGLAMGSMYGLLALGFYVTYSVSKTVNFSQGSSMMLGAVLTHTFAVTLDWNMALSIALALLLCAVWGVLVERVAVRPFAQNGSNTWLMSTVAIGIILENVALFTFGKEPRDLPSPLTINTIDIAGFGVYPQQLLIPAVVMLIAFSLYYITRKTKHGRALLAIVQNPRAAQLMGINVGSAIIIAYAISTVFAGIAGILIAPLFSVSAGMGTLFGIKAFAVAILGGMSSISGVILAGLSYGIAEAVITAVFGSSYTQTFTFTLVILALVIRPHGIFGRAEVKKV